MGTIRNLRKQKKNEQNSDLPTRDYQPRKEESFNIIDVNTPKVEQYHNLNNLHEDAELLQLFIEQIERANNSTQTYESELNKPIADLDLVTDSNKNEDRITDQVGDKEQELDNIESTTTKETSLSTEEGSGFDNYLLPLEPEETQTEKVVTEQIQKLESGEENVLFISPITVPRPKINICGVKGGKSVEQAYGKEASKYIMPLLIDSWVFGKDQAQKARFEDTEARLIGGKVTSTVLFCWVAAIMTDENEFVCTGTLVADDLVVTSGSCIDFLFKRGLKDFKVVLGDSNLKLELQFGVQEHKIIQALVHENYDVNDELHQNDIGFIILQTPARLEDNVCLLCLPKLHTEINQNSCTVTGFGKPTVGNSIPRGAAYWEDKTTDGILREAQLDILDNEVCSNYLMDNSMIDAKTEVNLTNLVCAGGKSNEKACFVAMDGGSPLACESNGHYYLGGLVTFGTACGRDEGPSIFVRVSEYVKWILDSYSAIRQ